MREIVLYIAQSLDGYIADRNDSIAWLGGQGGGDGRDHIFLKFFHHVDTAIMGHRTYDNLVNDYPPSNWPLSGVTTYVLSRQEKASTDEIKFFNKDAVHLLQDLREGSGQKIWVVGGSNLVSELVAADLIDRYLIVTMPIILGSGVRLFAPEIENKIPLRVTHAPDFHDGIVTTEYVRR